MHFGASVLPENEEIRELPCLLPLSAGCKEWHPFSLRRRLIHEV